MAPMKPCQITLAAALILGGCHLFVPYESDPQDGGPLPPDAAADLEAGPRPDRAGDSTSDMPPHDLPRDQKVKDKGKPDAYVVPTRSFCSKDKWCWMAPYPQGNNLRGVWRQAKDSVFAVGDHGTIMYYNGTQWRAMTSNTTLDLYDVWGTGLKDVHVVGENGATLHFDGHTWTQSKAPTTYTLFGICGYSKSEAYAVGEAGSIFHYDGKQWKLKTALGGKALYDVWCGSSPKAIYAVGDDATVIRGDGLKWDVLVTPIKETLFGVHGSGPKDVRVVGQNGAYFRFDGKAWKDETSPKWSYDFNAVHVDSAGAVIIAAAGGRIVTTAIGIPMSAPTATKGAFNAIGGSGTDIFIVGDNGGIARHTGKQVTLVSTSHFENLYGVWGASSSSVYAVGDKGTRLRYDGKAWIKASAMAGLDSAVFYHVWGSSNTNVYAVGSSARIMRFDGKGWHKEQSPHSTFTYLAVHGTSATDAMVVGTSGKMATFDGTKWTAHNPAKTTTYYGVWRDPKSIYAVGTELLTSYQNKAWKIKNVYSITFRGIWGDGAGKIYAVGSTGNSKGAIYRATGTTWTQVGPANTAFIDIWGNTASNAYVVGPWGAVVHFKGGTSWVPQESDTDRGLNGVWVDPKGTAFAVGDKGAILYRQP